jgi:AcrR family transcriptional regulator
MRPSALKTDDEADGHAVRSAATRAKLIEAAIEVFAAAGYEGASTRALAQHARANLGAIPYHFGGKRELYIAAAQTIAGHVGALMEPVVARMLDRGSAEPVERIDQGLSGFTRVIVGGPEPEAWVSFFLRCEHDADDAFRTIYEAVILPFERALALTAAEATHCDPADQHLRIRVVLVVASILSFRTLRNMTLGSLGWDGLTPDRLEWLDHSIRRGARRELLESPLAAQANIGRSELQIQPLRQPETPDGQTS